MESSLLEKIEQRAYELFLARGGQHGYHIEDWNQAEKEIMTSHEKKKQQTAPPQPVLNRSVEKVKSEHPDEHKETSVAPEKAAIPKKAEAATGTVAKKRTVKKKKL